MLFSDTFTQDAATRLLLRIRRTFKTQADRYWAWLKLLSKAVSATVHSGRPLVREANGIDRDAIFGDFFRKTDKTV